MTTTDYREFRVLYVDDEVANLTAFRYALDGQFQIEIASSGAEALVKLASQPIAVLLADQRLPGMTGAELCAEARRRYPDTVRMIVTAYDDVTPAVAAINTGHVARYILKPWREDAMAAVLRGGIEDYRLAALTRDLQGRLVRADQPTTTTYLVGRVLHDISSPATAAHMNVHAAHDTLGELAPNLPTAPRAILEQVKELRLATDDAVLSVDHLITRINTFRQRATSSGPSEEPSSIGQAVQAACILVRGEISRRARLVLDLEGDAMVAADAVALSRILVNLLAHACDSILPGLPEDNQIAIRLGCDQRRGWIEIEDTGPGIAPEDLARIFHPRITDQGIGHGMGLGIVHEIVRSLGGTITAGARAHGHGTRFVVELPLAMPAPAAEPSA